MVTVYMFKMPFQTNHFNQNQKVWVQQITGAMAAKCKGKYRGKSRYLSAWVNWDKKKREKFPFPKFKEIEVSEEFAELHKLYIVLKKEIKSNE